MAKEVAILSDTHLTAKFDKAKFDYLKSLFSKYESIVINGAFWSYYSCTFDEFLQSNWNALFPVMKEKTIYIYGNHDREKWCDEKIQRFCSLATERYILPVKDINLIIMHGHNIAGDSIQNETYLKIQRFLDIDKYNYAVQHGIISFFGSDFYTRLGRKMNNVYKKYAKTLPQNEILVTAHTHSPELSLSDKFINTGFINYGYASYLKILEGELTLVEELY